MKEYEYITESNIPVRVFYYELTDSTNTRAREYAVKDGACMPLVFIAGGQSAGRGRMGRSFDSAPGAGIYITFLFRPTGPVDAGKITAGAAVKTCRAIERVVDVPLGIKWVNDVYYGGKKLAGILCESQSDTGGLKYVAVGVGINIKRREFPGEIADIATTLEDAAGKLVSRKELTAALIDEFFSEWCHESLIKEYKSRSIVQDRRVLVMEHSGASYYADAVGITDNAGLLIRHNGEVREFYSGEISIKT